MARSTSARSPQVALVLSGGGARGAYEAGVLAGLFEVLGAEAARGPLFDVFTGTSVGAITATHMAACADRADHGIPQLLRHWTSLRIDTHLRPRVGQLLGWSLSGILRKSKGRSPEGERWGRALLDSRPLEEMVERELPWDRLHDNVRRGLVQALIISALNVADGRTVSFVELAPGATYSSSPDPRRASRNELITADHVLASAALPLLFPARRVGKSYYCDGGVRFNTPIAPAIRAGVNKLLVIALRASRPSTDVNEALDQYPNPIFLLGKILDALLLDPVDYDLQVLERFNRVLDVMAETAGRETLGRVARVLEVERGLPYRRLQTLVFRPSQDIGVLALEQLRGKERGCRGGGGAAMLANLAALGAHVEADFLSYLLFDGAFARRLIDLGRADVHARAGEVESFFAADARNVRFAG